MYQLSDTILSLGTKIPRNLIISTYTTPQAWSVTSGLSIHSMNQIVRQITYHRCSTLHRIIISFLYEFVLPTPGDQCHWQIAIRVPGGLPTVFRGIQWKLCCRRRLDVKGPEYTHDRNPKGTFSNVVAGTFSSRCLVSTYTQH
jgi:hypothetical protein